MALSLPIYFLGRTFVLHTRILGRQFKRSLKTADPRIAKLRAIELLRIAHMATKGDNPKLSDFDIDWARARRYELDLKNGVAKAQGAEDHRLMMEAIDRIGAIPGGWPKSPPGSALVAAREDEPMATASDFKARGPAFSKILEEFLEMKKAISKGTKTDYTATIAEFEKFAGKPIISKVSEQTVTDYMGWLAKRGNKEPTIDKKIGVLRALFNWGVKQRLISGVNPAAERNLQTREQKNAGGHKFYELDEVKQVLGCAEFKAFAQTQRSFHLIMVAAVVTGVRISALAALTANDFRVSIAGNPYVQVRKDKTPAGKRNVPIPTPLFDAMKAHLEESGGFGFDAREDGKGASDPVRKLLQAHLTAIGATGQGFTVHGLRKTLNNFLFHQGVDLEVRCQFIGHKIDHVNVGVYTAGKPVEKFTIDQIANAVIPSLNAMLAIIEFQIPS